MSRLLAPDMAGSEIADAGQLITIDPGEAVLVAQGGEKHRRDFTLGRFCAHAALAQLGGDCPAIGRRPNGAPDWPASFCGSITHTSGYAAAVAARRSAFVSLGLDAERVGGVTAKLWPRLFDAEECAMLSGLAPQQQPCVATILFSAKEASFKAWSPLGANALSFRDIHIERDGEDGFDAISSAGFLKGRFTVRGDLVLTAALVPAR
ncbi:MAG: 4'-phosphopantetheinyl transferase superfamily protein [Pseudomonadota bacterium]